MDKIKELVGRLPDGKFKELVEALPSIGLLLWRLVAIGISLVIFALVLWASFAWLVETFLP